MRYYNRGYLLGTRVAALFGARNSNDDKFHVDGLSLEDVISVKNGVGKARNYSRPIFPEDNNVSGENARLESSQILASEVSIPTARIAPLKSA